MKENKLSTTFYTTDSDLCSLKASFLLDKKSERDALNNLSSFLFWKIKTKSTEVNATALISSRYHTIYSR